MQVTVTDMGREGERTQVTPTCIRSAWVSGRSDGVGGWPSVFCQVTEAQGVTGLTQSDP